MVARKTLFVQPTKREPILIENLLKKGKYKQGNAYPVLHFTDAGEKLWDTAKEIDKKSSIIAVRAEASLDWVVSIKVKDLKILAQLSKYKVIGYKPEDCVLTIDFNGNHETITSFSHAYASRLERGNLEISDWRKFTKFTGISKDDVKSEWREIYDNISKKKDGVVVAAAEDEILTSFRSNDVIYKVKVENKLDGEMLDIRVKPIIPSGFSIDKEEETITKLESGQSQVVVFNIQAEKEHEGVEISADVEYTDSETFDVKKLSMKTRYVGRISK